MIIKMVLRCSKILTKHGLVFALPGSGRLNEIHHNTLDSNNKSEMGLFRFEMARSLLYTGSRKRIYSSYANCNSTVGFFLNVNG
jgi:hypothetical protein